MDLPSGINLAASLVTILGTTLTIMQALRHSPSQYRQDGGVASGYPSSPSSPSQAPRPAPAPRNAASSALHGRQPILRTGIGYGLGLGIAISIVVLTGTWLLAVVGWGQTEFAPNPQQLVLLLLMLAAVLSLYIAAGLVPARRVGSVVSGLLAGVIVAAMFDVITAAITTQMYPGTTLAENVREGIVPSLIGLAFSVIFAFLGRWTYHRALSGGEAPVGSSIESY
jgi:hypothetical protein